MKCDGCPKDIKDTEINRVTKGCCHEKVEYVYCDECYNARYK